MNEDVGFEFEKKDVIFWICIIGAVICLILDIFHSSYYGELSLAFIVGCLLYLYGKIGEISGKIALLPTSKDLQEIYRKIGEMDGRLKLLPTGEDVRRILREELEKKSK
jgi:hypothetical protein